MLSVVHTARSLLGFSWRPMYILGSLRISASLSFFLSCCAFSLKDVNYHHPLSLSPYVVSVVVMMVVGWFVVGEEVLDYGWETHLRQKERELGRRRKTARVLIFIH